MVQWKFMSSDQEQIFDLSEILNTSHENKWVAIAADYSHVVAMADTLKDLIRSVRNEDVIYHRVLPRDVSFAPVTL